MTYLQTCIHRNDTWDIKKKFQVCVNIFCKEGDSGVCEYADIIAQKCEHAYGIQIDQMLDFCCKYL